VRRLARRCRSHKHLPAWPQAKPTTPEASVSRKFCRRPGSGGKSFGGFSGPAATLSGSRGLGMSDHRLNGGTRFRAGPGTSPKSRRPSEAQRPVPRAPTNPTRTRRITQRCAFPRRTATGAPSLPARFHRSSQPQWTASPSFHMFLAQIVREAKSADCPAARLRNRRRQRALSPASRPRARTTLLPPPVRARRRSIADALLPGCLQSPSGFVPAA
jgi:hypothetical protein